MCRAREKPLCITSSCYKSFYFKIPKPEDVGECNDMYFVDCNETHEQYMAENLKASSFSFLVSHLHTLGLFLFVCSGGNRESHRFIQFLTIC